MTEIRTDQLRAGDVVSLPNGALRTVASIGDSGYVNHANEPILNVMYVEPGDDQWRGAGNSGIARSTWSVVNVA